MSILQQYRDDSRYRGLDSITELVSLARDLDEVKAPDLDSRKQLDLRIFRYLSGLADPVQRARQLGFILFYHCAEWCRPFYIHNFAQQAIGHMKGDLKRHVPSKYQPAKIQLVHSKWLPSVVSRSLALVVLAVDLDRKYETSLIRDDTGRYCNAFAYLDAPANGASIIFNEKELELFCTWRSRIRHNFMLVDDRYRFHCQYECCTFLQSDRISKFPFCYCMKK